MKMDVVHGECEYICAVSGEHRTTCMIHFAANEAPVAYACQLWKLFSHFNVSRKGLLKLAFVDLYQKKLKEPIIRLLCVLKIR